MFRRRWNRGPRGGGDPIDFRPIGLESLDHIDHLVEGDGLNFGGLAAGEDGELTTASEFQLT